MNGCNNAGQRGMSLIEVMVALLVLGIGVMGYAALQLRSVKMSEDTYARSQAMSIAQDAIERVRANVDGLKAEIEGSSTYLTVNWGADLPAAESRSNCTYTDAIPADPCDASEMVENDVFELRTMASTMLPSGAIAVAPCSQLTCVTVAWNETTIANCDPDEINEDEDDLDITASCVRLEFIP